MKMTTKMIMLQNIEKMVMEQQRVDENDSYIRQDNEDLKYLEERYDQLQLSHTVKRRTPPSLPTRTTSMPHWTGIPILPSTVSMK